MKAPCPARFATDNLVATYFDLGLAVSGAARWEGPGFAACRGPLPQPICNFAAVESLPGGAIDLLRREAVALPAFYVYALDLDSLSATAEVLRASDFRSQFRLVTMSWEGVGPEPTTSLTVAELPQERQEVARFMADQFFPRLSDEYRRTMSQVISRAQRLELFGRWEKGLLVGAVMLSSQSAVLGIYNLCVAPARRGGGLGAEIVAWCKARANRLGIPATLQCDPRLQPWYLAQGFTSVGSVEAFCLAPLQGSDIIEIAPVF